MAQKDLIPQNQRTKEEQKKIATMGGIASGEARREKKLFREAFEIALAKIAKDKDGKSLGRTNLAVGVAAVIEKFKQGDIQALKEIRDTVGEKPKEELEVKTIERPKSISVKVLPNKENK